MIDDDWWWLMMIDDADAKMFRSIQVFLFHHKVQHSAVYHICFSPKARKSATAATAASAPAEKAQKIEGHRSQRWFMLVLWFRCGKCAHVSEIGEMLFNCDLFTCRVFRVKGWRQLNQRFVEVHYQADVQQRTACRIVALKNGSFFFVLPSALPRHVQNLCGHYKRRLPNCRRRSHEAGMRLEFLSRIGDSMRW